MLKFKLVYICISIPMRVGKHMHFKVGSTQEEHERDGTEKENCLECTVL